MGGVRLAAFDKPGLSNNCMQHMDLNHLNTFRVPARAERMIVIRSGQELQDLLPDLRPPVRVLGGGSNILFAGPVVEGTLLKNEIRGKTVVQREENSAIVRVGAGENWHEFVLWCLDQNLGGVENLSLIPGTVGAAPIQNIGAYGVELKNVFHQLSAIRLSDGRAEVFSAADCAFGYRDSIFKQKYQGQYLIAWVELRLTTQNHRIHMDYGAIREQLREWDVVQPTIHDVSRAVIDIRQSKLPDPAQLGNAGSFFKNPILDAAHFSRLQAQYPDIVSYPADDGAVKVPAGWLIERCGWKGKRVGAVGCYEKQALVIVNYGGATGADIWAHAERVMESVWARFGVALQPEVNVW